MKLAIQIVGYIVLLGGSTTLGFIGKTAEMALAIVAGAIALAFSDIEKFSRIKGAGFEAELREKLEAVIDKETEPAVSGEDGTPVPDISRVDKTTRLVIDALQHPEYTWRYVGGIKEDTGLQTEEIMNSLKWLMAHGYARQSLGKHGPIWNLTEDGRYLSAVIHFTDADVRKRGT